MTDTSDVTHSHLSIALSAAVLLRIEDFKQVSWRELDARRPYLLQMIANHGDDILYRSKRVGDSAKAFNALVEAIAILSFMPGGVKIFGTHWQSQHPELASAGP